LKRAQAALEFLTTYAWAILSITIALGALYYFGAFDFSKFLPEKCILSSQMECIAFVMNDDSVTMKLVNNLGETIDVVSTSITDNAEQALSCTVEPTTTGWIAGDEWEVVFTGCSGGGYISKERVEAKISITYFAVDTPSQPRHTINGKLLGRVQ